MDTVLNVQKSREGHRQRLRERFLKSGLTALADYEVLELLLTLSTPRIDCKLTGKRLLERFGSLRGVLAAPAEQLKQVKGVGEKNVFGLRLAAEVGEFLLKERMQEPAQLADSAAVYDYLILAMRDLDKEQFRVIFLNTQNHILACETMFKGTVDASSVYPRDIMERALELKATGIICAHNHPGGNPHPSASDRTVTKAIRTAGALLNIRLLDHLIIGDNRYFSFADEGML